mgnify:CR=1 FL=1
MLEYIKQIYTNMKNNYFYSRDLKESTPKKNGFFSFFSSIFNYFFRRYPVVELSKEQRNSFEQGLDTKIVNNYTILYKPGEIILKRKNLDYLVEM